MSLTGRSRISPSWLFILPAILLVASFDRGSGSAQTPCLVGGTAELHYAPSEDLERIDVALIREAAKHVDVAAYVLTDRAVIEELREAARRGVKVRIWRDASMAGGYRGNRSAPRTSRASSALNVDCTGSAKARLQPAT
jgi:phosphatidylserine/phosphatidylglycerophosphate/cardiolipin synthase-like enzyme